jgi:phosphate transport system substrate-binding protein
MMNVRIFALGAVLAGLVLSGCNKGSKIEEKSSDEKPKVSSSSDSDSKLTGNITVDGSSTVLPIGKVAAEMFNESQSDVKTSVSESGTGGGFKKFGAGEIDIADASRPITAEEIETCKKNNIEFIEIPIAYDALTIAVNKENSAIDDITTDELKKIWEAGSKVTKWSEVRAGLPDEKINLFGPGDKSGTFEYFTEAINQKKKSSRPDYQSSEDDNILVKGVAGDKFSLGYFGYAYYEESTDTLKALKVNGVAPSEATVLDGTYTPLARPLFMYVNSKSFEKPQVAAFVKFILENATEIVKDAKYIPLPMKAYESVKARVDAKKTGSIFVDVKPGMKISDILSKESAK